MRIISEFERGDFPKTTSVLNSRYSNNHYRMWSQKILSRKWTPCITCEEYVLSTFSVNLFVHGRQVSVQKFNQLPLFTKLFHRLSHVKKLRPLVLKKQEYNAQLFLHPILQQLSLLFCMTQNLPCAYLPPMNCAAQRSNVPTAADRQIVLLHKDCTVSIPRSLMFFA